LAILRVVLVRPESPGNLGAVARVVKNTGLAGLDLVAPTDWRTVECWRQAWGAQEVLEQARVYPTLPEALAEGHQAFALTKKVKGEYHINYKGGGNYRFVVTAEEYKTAERVLDELVTTVTKEFTKRGGVATFARLGA